MVDNNSGLYESSTISTIAIGLIPIILWFTRFGTVFPPDWRVKAFAAGLVFACLLIPIGTEARTGLVCMALLGLLMLRDAKRRLLYIGGAALLGLAAIPFLPTSFTSRMDTIQGFKADESAGTRLAVWAWTWDYVQHHPFGGGFEAYRQNRIQVQTVNVQTAGETQMVTAQTTADEGRAYHSAYFEMLGEQGFPGLALFLLFHGIGLVRMEIVRRRYLRAEGDKAWIAPLATALQQFQLVYLVGALFVGIAFQPFVYLVLATQIGFDSWLGARERKGRNELGRHAFSPG
jgi:O-antigen ligase